MLSNRPDVRVAERELEQAFYVTNQANSAFYPSITLSGSAGWTNSIGGLITNPGKFVTSALASLTEPLFNRGTLIARRKIAKAQQEEALLAFRQKLLDAGSEVNDALVSYQTSKKKKENYEKHIIGNNGLIFQFRTAGRFPGNCLQQHIIADGTRQYHLSGSADGTSDLAKRPTVANRQPI